MVFTAGKEFDPNLGEKWFRLRGYYVEPGYSIQNSFKTLEKGIYTSKDEIPLNAKNEKRFNGVFGQTVEMTDMTDKNLETSLDFSDEKNEKKNLNKKTKKEKKEKLKKGKLRFVCVILYTKINRRKINRIEKIKRV